MEENMVLNNEMTNSNNEDHGVTYHQPEVSEESTAKGVLIGAGIALVTVGGIKAVKLISKKLKDVFSKDDDDEDDEEKPKKKKKSSKRKKVKKNVKVEDESDEDEDEENDDEEEEEEKEKKSSKKEDEED